MSWVSNANIKTIMQSIRNKFTTGDLVVANDDKNIGAEFNYGGQDGLLSVSPLGTGASTEAALHLCNGDDTKKTELTQGTLSYVQGSGDSETYNYLSLLGDGVATFGKNGGGNIQVGGVADPTSAQQVATKNYVDSKVKTYEVTLESETSFPPGIKHITSLQLYNTKASTICSVMAYQKDSRINFPVFASLTYTLSSASDIIVNLININAGTSTFTVSAGAVFIVEVVYK